ncbi:formylglycine-generating enzyme family protein [Nonomuraea diastatica]|uniref:Formylglycine-generating enzyme family protein n=2 Tax=Nonomuraea diastatica TaxID=1848329 RepID=A0A4R4WZ23_9ACTN|nr:formylglycine-generating enzyme family protein [Nonomuraea diastatica]
MGTGQIADEVREEARPQIGERGRHEAREHPDALRRYDAMVELPGGTFLMGTDTPSRPADGEGPAREVSVRPFLIDAYAVSNARFARFAEETGYVTETERIGWSYVFASFLPAGVRRVSPRPEVTPWWCAVTGADWRHPGGPGTGLDGLWEHPVVHLSWNDAAAYCAWAGARLATEAEWEYAARGVLAGKTYPWGDELTPGGEHMCNIWQGHFPVRNLAEDGYRGTAPVHAFPPNGHGLHNVVGNVWEWCADWWSDTPHLSGPAGPPARNAKVMRGGSYLCHVSYCDRDLRDQLLLRRPPDRRRVAHRCLDRLCGPLIASARNRLPDIGNSRM